MKKRVKFLVSLIFGIVCGEPGTVVKQEEVFLDIN